MYPTTLFSEPLASFRLTLLLAGAFFACSGSADMMARFYLDVMDEQKKGIVVALMQSGNGSQACSFQKLDDGTRR